MAPKELGLSLERIGLMFEEEVPTEQMPGMVVWRTIIGDRTDHNAAGHEAGCL
jgi:hypothetical protein